jgi:hypothetical protein
MARPLAWLAAVVAGSAVGIAIGIQLANSALN